MGLTEIEPPEYPFLTPPGDTSGMDDDSNGGGAAAEQARILIADDDESSVRLLEQILRRAGYHNLVGTTEARAVPGMFADQEPDLVLLDLHMPGMDAFQIIADFERLIAPGSYVPIMIITGDVTPEMRRKALVTGVEDFVLKPYQPTEVLGRIEHLLSKRYGYLASIGQTRIAPDTSFSPASRMSLGVAAGAGEQIVADATLQVRLEGLRLTLTTPEQIAAFDQLRTGLEAIVPQTAQDEPLRLVG